MSDFDEFDDLDPFEDDAVGTPDRSRDRDDGEALSEEEQFRRVDLFQEKTRDNMRKILKAKQFSKAERVEAIRWLGESGNHEAIPALIKVYERDKTPGMKDEAAYALGQMKALNHEMDDPELLDNAIQRIDDIILYDKFGRRANTRPLILAEVGLMVLAIVIFSAGLFLQSTVGAERANAQATSESQTQTAMPTATPDTEDVVRQQLQDYYTALAADATFFQRELTVASRQESINCDLSLLENPSAYTLSETWASDPRFADVVDQLNAARESLNEVRAAYTNACQTLIPIDPNEALNTYGRIVLDVQRNELPAIREGLTAAGITVEEPVFATSTPVPTETPDPELATPTADVSDLSGPIIALERIVADMTELQGPTTRIIFNWQQVVDTGALYLSGCNQPEPTIPEDYALAPEYLGVSANLESAVSNVNIGLQSTRLATAAFYEACAAGEVPEDALIRLQQAQLAQTALDSATANLNALQGQ